MCGILGYVGETSDAVPLLVEGLKRLEYRGYDSAGLAVLQEGKVARRRAEGKIQKLEETLREDPVCGGTGIAHTRWATHGRPSTENAHPHTDCSGTLVIVHNGIIEGYLDLKSELEGRGHRLATETDTEMIAHVVEEGMKDGIEAAVAAAVARLRGAYALAVLSESAPDKLVAAKMGPPLVIGIADDGNYISSDITALLPFTQNIIHLEDGEIAVVTKEKVTIRDAEGREVDRQPEQVPWDPVHAEKGPYKHFMLKEIYEQPIALRDTIMGSVSHEEGEVYLPDSGLDAANAAEIRRVTLLACGTSWHAALLGRYYIERIARLPARADVASEFRYRQSPPEEGELVVAISQSGETADTLAALSEARERGSKTLAVTNVPGSRMTRDAQGLILTHAGPEIGVAATKTFTTQIAALYLLALWLGRARGVLDPDQVRPHASDLASLPFKAEQALELDPICDEVAREFHTYSHFLYLGRGPGVPVAQEGALKLKEISYIHAEAYTAGEMKHGPIALINEEMPVVAVCPHDDLLDKMISNVEAVRARDGRVLIVTDQEDPGLSRLAETVFVVPACNYLTPLLMNLPLQLLAYHIGRRRGCDVDQPRNLAKSVTVE